MRMSRSIIVGIALLFIGSLAAPAAMADQKGRTRTSVAGGWEGTPPAVLTSIDPATGKYTVVGHAVWTGDWVGVSIFHMTGTLNMTTGDYVATAETEFTGSWLGDRSHGTLTWHEAMKGNAFTGAFRGTFDLVSGSGDPSFQCSSGHFIFSGYSPVPASYGGYAGTWVHGCRQ